MTEDLRTWQNNFARGYHFHIPRVFFVVFSSDSRRQRGAPKAFRPRPFLRPKWPKRGHHSYERIQGDRKQTHQSKGSSTNHVVLTSITTWVVGVPLKIESEIIDVLNPLFPPSDLDSHSSERPQPRRRARRYGESRPSELRPVLRKVYGEQGRLGQLRCITGNCNRWRKNNFLDKISWGENISRVSKEKAAAPEVPASPSISLNRRCWPRPSPRPTLRISISVNLKKKVLKNHL